MNRVDIQGVPVDAVEPNRLMSVVGELHAQGSATVAYANVHVVNQAQTDGALMRFLQTANLVYCDGNGVRLGAQILGQRLPPRSTGADWVWDLAAAAEGTWRLYWIGGTPGVTKAAADALRAAHPTLEIESDHGFHPRAGPEDAASIDRINAFKPDIVLVGMGTPEQERWVAERRCRIEAPVVWCTGATADVVTNKERRGPKWLVRRWEWLYRLYQHPSRLWRRYLIGNPVFVMRMVRIRLFGVKRA